MTIKIEKQYLGYEAAELINQEIEYAVANYNKEVINEMNDWDIAYAIATAAGEKTDIEFLQVIIVEYCTNVFATQIAKFIRRSIKKQNHSKQSITA